MSFKQPLPLPLLVLSALAVGLAAVQAFSQSIDNTMLILLGVAAVPWLLPYVKKWDGPFGEVEIRLETAEKELSAIKRSVPLPGAKPPREVQLEPSAGPVAPPTATAAVPFGGGSVQFAPSAAAAPGDTLDPEDPNKGRFGRLAQASGRELTATIKPAIDSRSRACEVELTVRSTDPQKPLVGKVTFFLHPTFGRWQKYSVKVERGVAQTDITSWGVFTVGVQADEGQTMLELDLAKVPGGTKAFYRN